MVMERMAESGLPLSKLAEDVVMYPQVTKNIPVPDKEAVLRHPAVKERLAACNARLGNNGRMLLRSSGTEPVVRIMVEAADEETCESLATEMEELIKREGLAL